MQKPWFEATLDYFMILMLNVQCDLEFKLQLPMVDNKKCEDATSLASGPIVLKVTLSDASVTGYC